MGLGLGLGLAIGRAGGGLPPALRPSLAYRFTDGTLTPWAGSEAISFTRSGSVSTRWNPSGFIETIGANLPRFDYDRSTLAPRGLLVEEQRTNIVLQSPNLDNTSSPWQNNTSFTITAKTSVISGYTAYSHQGLGLGSSGRTQNTTLTASTTYTLSAIIEEETALQFAWGLFDNTAGAFRGLALFTWSTGLITTGAGTIISSAVVNLGTGPNGGRLRRLSATIANGANTNIGVFVYPNGTGMVTTKTIVHHVQLEAGTFPTSVIPTAGAQVTRTADIPTATVGAFPAGALYASWAIPFDTGAVASVAALNAGSDTDLIQLYMSASDQAKGRIISGGSTQADLGDIVLPYGTIIKSALAWRTNDVAYAQGGSVTATDTSATIPTVTTLRVGHSGSGTAFLNGWVRELRLYGSRISDTQLEGITA